MLNFIGQEKEAIENWLSNICRLSINLLESKVGHTGKICILISRTESAVDKNFSDVLFGSLVLACGLQSSCWTSFLHIPWPVWVASERAAWNCLQKWCVFSWRPSDISHSYSSVQFYLWTLKCFCFTWHDDPFVAQINWNSYCSLDHKNTPCSIYLRSQFHHLYCSI